MAKNIRKINRDPNNHYQRSDGTCNWRDEWV